jgi:protein-tyrosine-phosphatase
MTGEQIDILRSIIPAATGKEVYTLKAFAGTEGDIADPAGQGESVFSACRDEIKACLERAIERLDPRD